MELQTSITALVVSIIEEIHLRHHGLVTTLSDMLIFHGINWVNVPNILKPLK
jgi:hypothetical protein